MNSDNDLIILNEIEDRDVILSPSEAAELQTAGLSLKLLPYFADGSTLQVVRAYRVNGNHNVGYFRLGSGRVVQVESKVPIANVFALLAIAYRQYEKEPPFLELTVPYSSSHARPLQALVEHFSDLVDVLLRDGLLRRYIEQEENLSTIRGRFLIEQQIRQNLVRSNRMFCRFATCDIDNTENRIVLWSLILLQRSGSWPERLRRKIQRQIMHFGGVSTVPIRARQVPQLAYDRLSGRYAEIHRWCRFFIDQMTLVNRTGEVEFCGFLLNMFELFERFVFCVFKEAARKRAGVQIVKQKLPLDTKRRVNILPDLLIKGPNFIAVGDAKYKITRDAVGRHPDLYQIISYSTALGLLDAHQRPQSFLIYPASEHSLELEGDLQILTSAQGGSQLSVRTLWIDLGRAKIFEHSVAMADSLLDDAQYDIHA